MLIAIAGNIGSGKTTLTGLLAKHYGWEAQYEAVDDNPYLDDFYADMSRWSYNLQIFFLTKRLQQIQEIRDSEISTVQDRTIYEDAEIFAKNLHTMEKMSDRDYDNYSNLYNAMRKFIAPPNLMIYLRASVPTLVRQIQQRGRSYENKIQIDYLQQLNDHYESWISGYRDGELLIVDVDNLDFVNNSKDLSSIIDKIESHIHGLF